MSQLNLFSSEFQVLVLSNTRTDDNWVNATKWCEHFGKQWAQIAKQPTFKKFMKALQVKLSTQSDAASLCKIINIKGNRPKQTWVHPLVGIKLLEWLAPEYMTNCELTQQEIIKKMINEDEPFVIEVLNFALFKNNKNEKTVQLKLAQTLKNAELEVCTPAGKIDILTSEELIEIKEWKKWKEAIGQVICYGDYYPSHQKRIHFFGYVHSDFIELVKKHCNKHIISISWE